MRSPLYLLDMMFFIHRAFHAVPNLQAPCGSPINALYGVLCLLKELWKQERYQKVVAVFESPTPTFRKALDPAYKANRPPAPLGLRTQVAMVRVACENLGIHTIHADGFEADDVIGTLAAQSSRRNLKAVIVSNDKDLAQVLAIDPQIELLRTRQDGRSQRITYSDVKAIYGVPAELIPSWLALRGDASDNIKGVKGIGQKTAVSLLNEHGNIRNLLAQPDKAGRFAPAFKNERERIFLDLKLATIRTNAILDFSELPAHEFQLSPISEASSFFLSLGLVAQAKKFHSNSKIKPTVADIWQEELPKHYH